NLMIEATFQNAGTLDKFLGDAVMSIFGAPIAHPDHAMRAVRTAVAMRDGIEGLSARRIRDGKDPLTVGIGVSTGDAVAGTVGTEDRMEYTVIGDSVNLAARLESNAKSMQILISGRTYRDVKEHVQARPLGEVKVKGKEEAVGRLCERLSARARARLPQHRAPGQGPPRHGRPHVQATDALSEGSRLPGDQPRRLGRLHGAEPPAPPPERRPHLR